MDLSKHLSPSPTDLIDWMNAEEILDLDWDFPEDGDLFEAGLDATIIQQLAGAVEDEYGVVLTSEELSRKNLATPTTLAMLIASKLS